MHHIYSTRAFVISSRPSGEANKLFHLFTHDLGLILGSAQGVRLDKSKLRYSLQDYSLVDVSLVRGKEVWRITSAREAISFKNIFENNYDASRMVARILALLTRLVGEGEKNEALFSILNDTYIFVTEHESSLTPAVLDNLELVTVLKIIHNLGYGGEKTELTPFVTRAISPELIANVASHRSVALSAINTAFKESHL